ncbi:MAG: hypothetical protein KAS32_08075 [Candidatus Peribacteraceae bacterium]|nr:hypothetical protein [Candidatus Peribacteraceae bacterium]
MEKSKKNIPKIKQNLDVKQKAVVGVRQLKEYLYNKRANLTYEEITLLIDEMNRNVMALAYESGWDDRNEIFRVRRSAIHTRMIKAFNDFYNENVGKIPVHIMEKIRYISDIGLLERYYNESLPFDHQVNDLGI